MVDHIFLAIVLHKIHVLMEEVSWRRWHVIMQSSGVVYAIGSYGVRLINIEELHKIECNALPAWFWGMRYVPVLVSNVLHVVYTSITL